MSTADDTGAADAIHACPPKGHVTFDPSRVTQATFDGLSAAVKVAAAAYGVPLPTPEDDGEGASKTTDGNAELMSKPALLAQAHAFRKQVQLRDNAKAKLFLQLSEQLAKADGELTKAATKDAIAKSVADAVQLLRKPQATSN